MTPILVLLFGIKPAIAVGGSSLPRDQKCGGTDVNEAVVKKAACRLQFEGTVCRVKGYSPPPKDTDYLRHLGTVDFVLLESLLVGSLPGI